MRKSKQSKIFSSKKYYAVALAVFNALISFFALIVKEHYVEVQLLSTFSFVIFVIICFLESNNLLFLARTFILGFIGYFPMVIKVILGEAALFSGYESSTQGFDIVVLMYVTTSFALLSNQIGLTLAEKRIMVFSNTNPVSFAKNSQNYWRIAGAIGVLLAIISSYILVRGAGKTVFEAAYASAEQGGEGVPFGSVVVFGGVGIFSLFVAGMKGYIKNWKIIFIVICFTFIIYANLFMGGRLEAMSTVFGLFILYGVIKRRKIGFKLFYIPILIFAYFFLETWGVARTALSLGVSITDIINEAFTSIRATDAIQMGTISPIATTFSNTVWLIQNNVIHYSFGQSYGEWILRIPPEAIYPNRPLDYAWMFGDYGLSAQGGFFELAEVYMNYGLFGALVLPGAVSFLMAKSYYYAFYRQSMLGYFLLFSFLAIFFRGTWYQTFAFFRAFLVCTLLYFSCVFLVQLFQLAIRSGEQRSDHH